MLTQSELRNEEYAVYSALISEMYVRDKTKLVIINHKSSGGSYDEDTLTDEFQSSNQTLASAERAAIKDYISKNQESHLIERSFNFKVKYLLVGWEELREAFKEKGGDNFWSAFYERYPDSSGYITLSRVGFNPEMTEAFTYVELGCGGTCGEGTYVVLTKEGKVWKVEKQLQDWVS